MSVWLVLGLVGCGASSPEPATGAPPAEGELVEGVAPIKLGEDGPTLVARRSGGGVFNSKPDHPVTRVTWRGHLGLELFIDGEPVGVLPVTKALALGPHTFEVLLGPGDKQAFEKHVVGKPGILIIDLGT